MVYIVFFYGLQHKGRSPTLSAFPRVKLGSLPGDGRMESTQSERRNTPMDFLNYHLCNNNMWIKRQPRLLVSSFCGCCP